MKYSASNADIGERLEDANLNSLDNTAIAIVPTGGHSNTTSYGRVSIGVQVGVPGNNEAETRDTDADELTFGVEGEICRSVSVGVDAGKQVGGKIEMGSFFEGGELVSITTCHDHVLHLDLGSNITVTGGNFKTVYGDFYELPEEFKRSVKSCHLTTERFADWLHENWWPIALLGMDEYLMNTYHL